MSKATHGAQHHVRHTRHPRSRRWWGLQTQTCCSFQPTRLVLTVISSQTGGETVNRLRVIAAAPRPQATAPGSVHPSWAPPPRPAVADRPLESQAWVPTPFLDLARRAFPAGPYPAGFGACTRLPANVRTPTHPGPPNASGRLWTGGARPGAGVRVGHRGRTPRPAPPPPAPPAPRGPRPAPPRPPGRSPEDRRRRRWRHGFPLGPRAGAGIPWRRRARDGGAGRLARAGMTAAVRRWSLPGRGATGGGRGLEK